MSDSNGPRCEVVARFVRSEAFRDPCLASRACALLGAVEMRTYARLRRPAVRRDYLAAHALARTMLAECAGCDPARVPLRSSRWGAPVFVAPPGAPSLRLSLSHADGVALCAVAQGCAVGADVESLRNVGADPLALAAAVCSRGEMAALRALPASARTARFLTFWTRKEAIAKATGLGVYLPFVEIAADGWTGRARGAWSPLGARDEAAPSRIVSVVLTPDHVAAVAVLGAARGTLAFRIEEAPPGVVAPASLRPQ